jgi:hypothetical protein
VKRLNLRLFLYFFLVRVIANSFNSYTEGHKKRSYRAARRYRWEFLQKRQELEALEAQEGLDRYTYTPTPEDTARFADALPRQSVSPPTGLAV